MKVVIVLLLLAFTTSLHAQEHPWDIRLATAASTQPYLHQGGAPLFLSVFQSKWKEVAFTESVTHPLNNKHIRLGLSAAQSVITQYHVPPLLFSSGNDSKYAIRKEKVFTLMPSFQYSFIDNGSICLYSGLSAGLAFSTTKEYDGERNSQSIQGQGAYQFTFAGFRLGKRIAAFFEAGYGYEGIVKIGVSGQL